MMMGKLQSYQIFADNVKSIALKNIYRKQNQEENSKNTSLFTLEGKSAYNADINFYDTTEKMSGHFLSIERTSY